MGCLLFGAGRGERLRPLTDVVPKPALPLLDVPLGTFGLRALGALGPPVTINAHHLAGELRPALEHYANPPGLELFLEWPEVLGTAGTLRSFGARLDRVVTCNADVVTDLDARRLLSAHERAGALATVAVARVAAGADFEVSGGRAVCFVDRRERAAAPGAQFLGAAVFDRGAMAMLPERVPAGLGEALLPLLAERGELALYEHDGYHADVGMPGRYLAAALDLLGGRGPRLAPPGVMLEMPGGRAYVGPGARIEGGHLEPGAVVLTGAALGPGASVARALVWPGETVPAGAELSDCIWALGRAIPAPH